MRYKIEKSVTGPLMNRNTNDKKDQPSRVPFYIQLVNDMIDNIDKNIYKPGEKLPSIRHMSEARGLSIMTVLKAYQELLSRGYIVSRPQSGYYVIGNQTADDLQKHIRLSTPRHVEMPDMTRLVLLDSSNEALVPLGSGVPSESLLPLNRLTRITTRLLQSHQVPLHITGNAEGCANLRIQLAKHMFLSNTPAKADDIIVTSGCNESIFIAFSVTCNPGDLVAVESPCYFGTLQILQELGLRAIEIPVEKENGIDVEILKTALEQNPIKAIFVNSNCNNPLGSIIPEAKKKMLAELTEKYNVPLIEDDSIGDLYFGRIRPGTIKSYDKKGLVLYCSSFSKVLAPAYRVGWIVPGKYKNQVIQFKHALNLSTSPLLQESIAAYLEDGAFERQMRKARQAYFQKILQMGDCIRDTFPEDTVISSPKGGIFLWVTLSPKIDTVLLYHDARAKGISIAPGRMFSIHDTYSNCLRLNAAFYTPEIKTVFYMLGSLIRKYK